MCVLACVCWHVCLEMEQDTQNANDGNMEERYCRVLDTILETVSLKLFQN